MGQNQTKPTQSGVYQQEQLRESQRDETAMRIRRKLEQGKVKPDQPNFPIQNYQPPPQTQPQQQYQPPQINIHQQPAPQYQPQLQAQPITPVHQQNRKNIQIKPPRDMIREDNQRRGSVGRNKSSDGRPPKPKSAKTVPQPPPSPKFVESPPPQMIRVADKPELDHENIIKLSPYPFPNCIHTDKGFLEHCEVSLAQLIESRYNTKMYFPQQNVIALFESMIYAMAALQAKQIAHHDIYPTNIYFQNSIFKLSNPILTPFSSYHLTLSRKRFSFLSPQLIICLREEIPDVKEDLLFRADMFSLGLVMLEFCSLKPSQECYDQDNYDIIDVAIKRRLADIKQIYNPKISEGIELLLRYQLGQRMGALEFSRHLNQAVHQAKQEAANAKRSQVNIQGQQGPQVQQGQQGQQGQSTSRVNIIAPGNLPNGMTQTQMQQSQPHVQQPPPTPPPQQIAREIPRQIPQTHQYQIPQQVIQQRPAQSPPPSYNYSLPPQSNNTQYQPQPQQQPQQQPQYSTQNNSRVKIMPPSLSSPLFQSQTPPPTHYEINIQPPPQQQKLPSYPYIQSPISPSVQVPPQVERTYISSPPPQYTETKEMKYTTNEYSKYSTTSQSPIASGYIIVNTPPPQNSKYTTETYTFESSGYASSTPFPKALGELEYSNIPSYLNNPPSTFMKPEKDAYYTPTSYKDYQPTYNDPIIPSSPRNIDPYYPSTHTNTTREFYKEKDWTDIKNDLNNKYTSYGVGGGYNSMTSAEESLEERVRRILEKSKQIK